MKSQFLIAAPSSNSGKTMITLALLNIFKTRGLSPQPFKCGPDYLDTRLHSIASGKPGINLDSFMMSHRHLTDLYGTYANEAQSCIVEGVMGLFDGADKSKGSSAEIAMILDLPIILVVNAKSMAYSAAPLLYGFKNFNPKIRIAGVIFNYVRGESHYKFLKQAAADVGIEALGYLCFNEKITIPSRHLGLTIDPTIDFNNIALQAAEAMEKTVNIDRIIEITTAKDKGSQPLRKKLPRQNNHPLKIAVASDEAFNFIYHQNIELLKRKHEVIFFSPVNDKTLPTTDVLYFPGGYPELYPELLSSNVNMINQVREFCEKGGKVLAECGGLMYMGKKIIGKDGSEHPMVGFFDIETSMKNPKLTLGYRTVELHNNLLKGHEFHYSELTENSLQASILPVADARQNKVTTKLYFKKNVVATYIHLYWGDEENILDILFNGL